MMSSSNKRARRQPLVVVDYEEDDDRTQDFLEDLPAQQPSLDLDRFETWLNEESENTFGGWDQLEKSKKVLDGNYKLSRSHLQLDENSSSRACKTMERAQYGRTRSPFVDQVLRLTKTTAQDVFFDLGSGIGTVVLQAAATIGCKSVGVEICIGRHQVALELQQAFNSFAPKHLASRVDFFHGDFRTKNVFDLARESTVLFVNNANGVFNMRSNPADCYSLDWHVARLVGGMKDGSRIMCYDSLSDLDCAPLNQCFSKQAHISAKGATSWTEQSKTETHFCVYVKLSSAWTCERCKSSNTLVVEAPNAEWSEKLNDECATCVRQGHRKPYGLRVRTATPYPYAKA